MRDTDWTPSIVPGDDDRDTCLVVNDFGRRGRAWCETDVEATDLETVIQDLLDGQFSEPVRVVSFDTGEGPLEPAQDQSGAATRATARRHFRRTLRAGRDRPRPVPGCPQHGA
jgi:hypothetical protein